MRGVTLEQYDNKKLQKIGKSRTPYRNLKNFRKSISEDIKTLKTKDINSAMNMFMEVMKYPIIYVLCINLTDYLGKTLTRGMAEEEFYTGKGNIYHLLGNILFLFVITILLRSRGRSFRSQFSLFRDHRLLCHAGKKNLKADIKAAAKRCKRIFSKGITAKSVRVQYLMHFFAGITLGLMFMGIFLLATDSSQYIRCLNDAGLIFRGSYELIGLLTFVFLLPFIEELIYHANNMTVLRKDVTAFTASFMVTVLYMLFHKGKTFAVLFIPVMFLISLVFDRTQNTRHIGDYVSGRTSKSQAAGTAAKDKIISIKDRVGKNRKLRFKEKSTDRTLHLAKNGDVRIDGNIDIEVHTAEAVNDLGGIKDTNKEFNITDISSERPDSAKPDITYSLLMNVGVHMSLAVGWVFISYHEAEVGRIFSKQVLIFLVIFSVLILYKFIKKQHLCGVGSTK
ncbi:hypothetical protein BXO88_08500 [Oribacterium sp. C9]|nr:hypothetical protein BXO88_08500 [Oribacterium sp. C9]